VEERARTVARIWPGSAEEAWQYFRDHAEMFSALMDRVPADKWENVTREIVAAVKARRVPGGYDLEAHVLLATADKL